jgi:hypothetical protein
VNISLPPFPIEGGCACGACRYRLAAAPLSVHACHCLRCQMYTGAAYGISMPVLRKHFTLLRGTLREYVSPANSGRSVPVLFCERCGTRVMHTPEHSPHLVTLFPGTLDDPSWTRPVAHLWLSRKRDGVVIDPETLQFDTQPDDRQGIYDTFLRATNR